MSAFDPGVIYGPLTEGPLHCGPSSVLGIGPVVAAVAGMIRVEAFSNEWHALSPEW
jgi:hypothetical protein